MRLHPFCPGHRRLLGAAALLLLGVGTAGLALPQVRPLVLEDPGRGRPLPAPPIYAPRQATLEPRWETEINGSLMDGLVAGAGGIVYALLDGRIGAVDAGDGHPLWEQRVEGLAWAPSGLNRVLVAGGGSKVTALSPQDGRVAWTRSLPAPLAAPPRPGPESSDVQGTHPPVVVVLLDNGELRALDGQQGNDRWRAQLECRSTQPPLVTTHLLIVACEDGSLVALDTADGTPLWRRRLPARPTTPPLADEERVFVGLGSGDLLAVGRKAGRGRYAARLAGNPSGTLLFHGPYVLTGAQDNILYAFSRRLGHLAWSVDAGARILSPPATRGNLLALSPRLSDILMLLDARDGAVLARGPQPGRSRVSAGAPAFAGSKLITATQPQAGGRGWLNAHHVTLEVLADEALPLDELQPRP